MIAGHEKHVSATTGRYCNCQKLLQQNKYMIYELIKNKT